MAVILFAVVLLGAVALFAHPDGRRWLHRWELGRVPTDAEVARVAHHFYRRRVIALVAALVLAAILREGSGPAIVPAMLVAILVAEVLDGRGTGSRVPAPLVPRWARWALWAFAVAVVVGLAATAWLSLARLPPTFSLGAVATLVTVVVVALIVRLASTRPAVTGVDRDIDLLLRARAARVATGLGLAVLGYLLSVTGAYVSDRLQPLTVPGWSTTLAGAVQVWGVILGVVAWICVANPPTKPVLVSHG